MKKRFHKLEAIRGTPSPTIAVKVWWKNDLIFGLFIAIVLFLVYFPAWHGQPVWDDDNHITPLKLQSWNGLQRIWIEPGATVQYYPLVYTTFWLGHRLWGQDPFGYHLLNILLQSISAFLLLTILRHLKVPGAPLAATLFALHPVQVESVAWISELKNCMSGVFYLGSMLLYLRYIRDKRTNAYVLSLLLFIAALLSKSVTATLPAALLVIIWWKNGRISWKRDISSLIPFFAMGIGFGLLTVWMELTYVGAAGPKYDLSIVERCLVAGRALAFYVSKLVWPDDLIFIYPRWQINADVWWQYLFPLSAFMLLVLLWLWRKQRPAGLAALLLFGGTLFPALGFFYVYPFRYSFVADHFQYLASIVPLTIASFVIIRVFGRVAVVVGIFLAATLSILSWRQAQMYTDLETLWHTTIERNPSAAIAYTNLGYLLQLNGRANEAIPYLERAIAIDPNNAEAHNTLGMIMQDSGKAGDASQQFQKAIEIDPNFAIAYNNLGTLLAGNGDPEAAITNFKRALELKPDYLQPAFNLGVLSIQVGRYATAVSYLELAVDGKPNDSEAHFKLGLALQHVGRTEEAISHYKEATRLKSDHIDAHGALGFALVSVGRFKDAIAELELAVALNPDNIQVLNELAWLLSTVSPSTLRDGPRAVAYAEHLNQILNGTDPTALRTLAAAHAEAGHFADAIAAAERGLQATGSEQSSVAQALKSELALYKEHSAIH